VSTFKSNLLKLTEVTPRFLLLGATGLASWFMGGR